ncbi:DUF2231 domain-containing protein [Deinococcus fonticola]|uniref:DUF2231 domain-containing protein n=1 Tax=Deinococcus fonticola TaxID=2528713 RepID=UPI001074B791|nr:DUF2231 domain-containing protein [Deinococcus fonticola]
MSTLPQQFENAVASNEAAEQLARELQPLVRQAEALLPQAVQDALRGEWLGHPLHPALVHLPLGGWIAAAALDAWPGGDEDTEKAADLALLLATLGALPTLAAGWTEWAELQRQPRRTGVVHGLMEETAFFLNVTSLLARRKGNRRLGKLLSGAGLGLALAGGLLGGQLVYGHGVGVKETRR